MYISNLCLEVTRKCNLRCEHCCRGACQRLTMTREVMSSVLSDISSIGIVTFTGGEPSLAPEVIEEFYQQCLWRHLRIGSFYVVSNARPHSKYSRFQRILAKLYDYADDKDMCSLEVSRDQYHEFYKELLYKFQDEYTGEYPPYFHPNGRTEFIKEALDEGRAKENQLYGNQPARPQTPWLLREDDQVLEPEVYVAANGNVVSECNMSYRRMDIERKGNVLQTSLSEIIRGFCKPEEDYTDLENKRVEQLVAEVA